MQILTLPRTGISDQFRNSHFSTTVLQIGKFPLYTIVLRLGIPTLAGQCCNHTNFLLHYSAQFKNSHFSWPVLQSHKIPLYTTQYSAQFRNSGFRSSAGQSCNHANFLFTLQWPVLSFRSSAGQNCIIQISTLHYTAQFRNSPFQQPTDNAGLLFTHFAQDSHIGTTQCHWLFPSL